MITRFNKKETYCPHMYVGFQGHHQDYSIMCSKTTGDCIAYEETLVKINEENDGDQVKRHWTNWKTWRVDLNLIKRCPANRQREQLTILEVKEEKVEEDFFGELLEELAR